MSSPRHQHGSLGGGASKKPATSSSSPAAAAPGRSPPPRLGIGIALGVDALDQQLMSTAGGGGSHGSSSHTPRKSAALSPRGAMGGSGAFAAPLSTRSRGATSQLSSPPSPATPLPMRASPFVAAGAAQTGTATRAGTGAGGGTGSGAASSSSTPAVRAVQPKATGLASLLMGDEMILHDEIAPGPSLLLPASSLGGGAAGAGQADRSGSDSIRRSPPPAMQLHRPHASHDFLASGSFDSPSPTTPSSLHSSPNASPTAGAVGSGGTNKQGASPNQSPVRNPIGGGGAGAAGAPHHQSNRSGRWNSNTPRAAASIHTPQASIFDGSDASAAAVAASLAASPAAIVPSAKPSHQAHTSIDFSGANAVPLLAHSNVPNVHAAASPSGPLPSPSPSPDEQSKLLATGPRSVGRSVSVKPAFVSSSPTIAESPIPTPGGGTTAIAAADPDAAARAEAEANAAALLAGRPALYPIDRAYWWSIWTLGFLGPILSLGNKRALEMEDVPTLSKEDHTGRVVEVFERVWHKFRGTTPTSAGDKPKAAASPRGPGGSGGGKGKIKSSPLMHTLLGCYSWGWIIGAVCTMLGRWCLVLNPLLIKEFLVWVAADESEKGIDAGFRFEYGSGELGYGGIIVASLVALMLFSSIVINHAYYQGVRIGCAFRTALMSLIFEKALRCSSFARVGGPTVAHPPGSEAAKVAAATAAAGGTGQTVNLMANDTQQIFDAATLVHFIYVDIILILGTVAVMYWEIGVSALPAGALMLILLPIQIAVARRIGRNRAQMVRHTDSRVKILSEILQGIRVIKLYAWEVPMAAKVQEVRLRELECVKRALLLKSFNLLTLFLWPVLVSMVTFVVYVLLGNELTVIRSITILGFVNVLSRPITVLPTALISVAEVRVAVARIEKFLTQDELQRIDRHEEEEQGGQGPEDGPGGDKRATTGTVLVPKSRPGASSSIEMSPLRVGPSSLNRSPFAIEIAEGSFAWDRTSSATLENISFGVRRGALVGVIGGVGSGKSSLLSAILGEMHPIRGSVTVRGRVGYMSQQPWIQNCTVRDNILFGLPYDQQRYEATLEAACLATDLKTFSAGDQTEIGERGITMSGGQKARCLSSSSLLASPKGVIRAGDVQVGTQLVGQGGQPVTVIRRATGHDSVMFQVSYRIGASDSSHTVTADHLVTLRCGQGPWVAIAPTEDGSEIAELRWWDRLTLTQMRQRFRFVTPAWTGDMPTTVETFNTAEEAIEAACLYGREMLADKHATRVSVCSEPRKAATGSTSLYIMLSSNSSLPGQHCVWFKLATPGALNSSPIVPVRVTHTEVRDLAFEWLAELEREGKAAPLQCGDLVDVRADRLRQTLGRTQTMGVVFTLPLVQLGSEQFQLHLQGDADTEMADAAGSSSSSSAAAAAAAAAAPVASGADYPCLSDYDADGCLKPPPRYQLEDVAGFMDAFFLARGRDVQHEPEESAVEESAAAAAAPAAASSSTDEYLPPNQPLTPAEVAAGIYYRYGVRVTPSQKTLKTLGAFQPSATTFQRAVVSDETAQAIRDAWRARDRSRGDCTIAQSIADQTGLGLQVVSRFLYAEGCDFTPAPSRLLRKEWKEAIAARKAVLAARNAAGDDEPAGVMLVDHLSHFSAAAVLAQALVGEAGGPDAARQVCVDCANLVRLGDSGFEYTPLSGVLSQQSAASSSSAPAVDVQVVYMLHNPLVAESMRNAQGKIAFTLRQLERVWQLLELSPAEVSHILISELSPLTSKTGGLDSRDARYDELYAQTMRAALLAQPKAIVAFGVYVRHRWLRDVWKLRGVDSAVLTHDAEGREQLAVTFSDGAQTYVVQVLFAPHPSYWVRFMDLLRACATAHGRQMDRAMEQRATPFVQQSTRVIGVKKVRGGEFTAIEVDDETKRFVLADGVVTHNCSMARAVYRAQLCDIYLLDDPFAAVDVHVGTSMFHDSVAGVLHDKTRIVVLNSHLHLLKHFDEVVVIEKRPEDNVGFIAARGTYAQMEQRYPALLAQEQLRSQVEAASGAGGETTTQAPRATLVEIKEEEFSSAHGPSTALRSPTTGAGFFMPGDTPSKATFLPSSSGGAQEVGAGGAQFRTAVESIDMDDAVPPPPPPQPLASDEALDEMGDDLGAFGRASGVVSPDVGMRSPPSGFAAGHHAQASRSFAPIARSDTYNGGATSPFGQMVPSAHYGAYNAASGATGADDGRDSALASGVTSPAVPSRAINVQMLASHSNKSARGVGVADLSSAPTPSPAADAAAPAPAAAAPVSLMTKEDRAVGSVGFHLYRFYFDTAAISHVPELLDIDPELEAKHAPSASVGAAGAAPGAGGSQGGGNGTTTVGGVTPSSGGADPVLASVTVARKGGVGASPALGRQPSLQAASSVFDQQQRLGSSLVPLTNGGSSKSSTPSHGREPDGMALMTKEKEDSPPQLLALPPPEAPVSADVDGASQVVQSRGYAGLVILISVLLLFLLCQGLRMGCDLWVTYWGKEETANSAEELAKSAAAGDSPPVEHSVWFWIVGCALWSVVTFSVVGGRAYLFVALAMRVSERMHRILFRKLLLAPVTLFYDVTPLGRVLNRMSKDFDQVDSFCPDLMSQFMQHSMNLFGGLVLSVVSTPYFLAVIAPVFVIFSKLQAYFRLSSRELKRLEGVTRSPIFSMFSESLLGLATIRAYRAEKRFIATQRERIAHNAKIYTAFYLTSRWLSLRLDFVSNFLVLAVGLFGLFLRSSMDTTLIGLALLNILQFTGFLQWTVRVSVDTENSMTSVERLSNYMFLPQEAPYVVRPELTPPASWPSKGEITFNNLRLRYRPELPWVLKGVSCAIRAREKIGICGRTGSGKSSLMVSLFRLVESPTPGAIVIDGVDIGTVGLQSLRSGLSIIPQDPVLFSGNIRQNLDPFGARTDQQLWTALAQVSLKTFVESLPMGLDSTVAEYGDNYSSGQRQLICIARALLRQSRIIVLDEATAAVDNATDALIQATIRDCFADCTVLTIAHRLNTIMDSTRVMVLDNGYLAEFDTPHNLLSKPDGIFANMVRTANNSKDSHE